MRLINITTCPEHFFYCEALFIIHAPCHTHNSCKVKNPLLICPLWSHCYHIGHNFMVGCDMMWNICEVQYCITQEQTQMPTAYYTVPECTTVVYVL
jgi:hypothetical protein